MAGDGIARQLAPLARQAPVLRGALAPRGARQVDDLSDVKSRLHQSAMRCRVGNEAGKGAS